MMPHRCHRTSRLALLGIVTAHLLPLPSFLPLVRCGEVDRPQVVLIQPIPPSSHHLYPSPVPVSHCQLRVSDQVHRAHLFIPPGQTKQNGRGARKSMLDNSRNSSSESRSGWRANDKPRTPRCSVEKSSSDPTVQ